MSHKVQYSCGRELHNGIRSENKSAPEQKRDKVAIGQELKFRQTPSQSACQKEGTKSVFSLAVDGLRDVTNVQIRSICKGFSFSVHQSSNEEVHLFVQRRHMVIYHQRLQYNCD